MTYFVACNQVVYHAVFYPTQSFNNCFSNIFCKACIQSNLNSFAFAPGKHFFNTIQRFNIRACFVIGKHGINKALVYGFNVIAGY